MEADGRQADEPQHQRRAHAAFEPIQRVGPELRRQLRNARIGESARRSRCRPAARARPKDRPPRSSRRTPWRRCRSKGSRRRGSRWSATARRPGSATTPRTARAPSAGTRTDSRIGAQPREHQREQEAGAGADRHSEHRERHRPHHAHHLDRKEVRPDQAGREPAHLGPWIERDDREVGDRSSATAAISRNRPLADR